MLKHPRQKQLLMLMMLFPLIFILRWISSENNLIDHFLVFPVGSKLRLEKFFSVSVFLVSYRTKTSEQKSIKDLYHYLLSPLTADVCCSIFAEFIHSSFEAKAPKRLSISVSFVLAL